MLSTAACGSTSPPAEPVAVVKSSTTITTIATTTTVEASTSTTIAPELSSDGIARALLTTTNVVVPVLGTTDTGWLVHTPCQNEAHVLEGTPIDSVHVVLDPGHGGAEAGAVAADLTEADVNLAVAQSAAAQLSELGFAVVLTRYTDVRMPIETRVEIADTLRADLLVSIHHQGSGDFPASETPGTEVYYQQASEQSMRFAGILWEEAVEALGTFGIDGWFGGPDAGATYRPNADTGEDFYGMLRRPSTTAVLAEMSFLGNPIEAELLATDQFRVAEARSIANAVVRWYTTDDSGSGFVEPSFDLRSSGGGGGLAGCTDPDLGSLGDGVARAARARRAQERGKS